MSLRVTSSALALMAFTMPAFADVTPEEVWQTWLDYYQTSGYTITEGAKDQAGETLTLKDVKFENTSDDNKTEFTVPQITLQATGDGKVRTTYADSFPVTFSGVNADDKPFTTTMTFSIPGNETVTSGTKGDLVSEMKLPELTVSADKIDTGNASENVNFKFTATNTTGTFRAETGEQAKYDTKMKSEKAGFEMSGAPDGQGDLTLTASIDGLDMDVVAAGLSAAADLQSDLSVAIEKGLDIAGSFKAGKTIFDFNFNKPENAEDGSAAQSGKGNGTVDGFDVTLKMAKSGLVYQGNAGKIDAQITASDLPFPITYGMNATKFDIQFPVSKSDEPQPFKVAYSLDGLTLGDEIWSLFDPAKQLPRDPATFDVDVSGTMKVVQNVFDEDASNAEAAADGEDEDYADDSSPFEPVDLTINKLVLSAVGAKVSATGSLKPSDEGGIEAPVGAINARYEGVNGLIDNLGKMGLIPEDQMAGVRMMLAMFARPADGNDVLTTDLEFKEDGSVFANGQQVK